MSDLEVTLRFQLRAVELPEPVQEWPFHPVRKWRFDFAWPERLIAAEVEGGTFHRGRHTRGMGYHKDLEKYNEATRLGWRVFRFDKLMVDDGTAVNLLMEVLRETLAP